MPSGKRHPQLWSAGVYSRHMIVGRDHRYRGRHRRPAVPRKAVFQYTLRGALHSRIDGVTATAGPGQALLFTCDEEGERWVDDPPHEPYEFLFVNLHGDGVITQWNAIRFRFGSVVTVKRRSAIFTALDRLLDVQERGASAGHHARLVSEFIFTLFEQLERAQAAGWRPVDQAVASIVDNPHLDRSLQEIADEHGVSRSLLSRTFKERHGLAPATWLRRTRLARATELLASGDIPLPDVVQLSGLPSLDTLERLFRQTHRCSPTTWRKRLLVDQE